MKRVSFCYITLKLKLNASIDEIRQGSRYVTWRVRCQVVSMLGAFPFLSDDFALVTSTYHNLLLITYKIFIGWLTVSLRGQQICT